MSAKAYEDLYTDTTGECVRSSYQKCGSNIKCKSISGYCRKPTINDTFSCHSRNGKVDTCDKKCIIVRPYCRALSRRKFVIPLSPPATQLITTATAPLLGTVISGNAPTLSRAQFRAITSSFNPSTRALAESLGFNPEEFAPPTDVVELPFHLERKVGEEYKPREAPIINEREYKAFLEDIKEYGPGFCDVYEKYDPQFLVGVRKYMGSLATRGIFLPQNSLENCRAVKGYLDQSLL